MSRLVIAAGLCLTLQACRGNGGRADRIEVRDSAGTRIVQNRGDVSRIELAWKLAPRPEADIGGDENGKLHRVTSATRLGDGRIVVANAGASTLEIYGTDGGHLQSVGRAGEGPGEFRALFWVGRAAGDTILGWDSGLARLSIFAPDGRFVRTVTPRAAVGLFPQAAGAFADGRLLLGIRSPLVPAGSGATVQRDTVSYVVLASTGDVQRVTRVPGSEMLVQTTPGFLMRPLPFGHQTVAVAGAGRVYVGTGDAFEVVSYEPGGRMRTIVRAEHHPARVTRDDIRDYQRSLVTLGAEGDARLRAQDRELLAHAPYPREMPPFVDLKADPEGNLWVQAPRRPAEPNTRWTVFSSDGRALGVVSFPADLAVQEIGRDWVLGTALDENQLEHVRLYRLEKS